MSARTRKRQAVIEAAARRLAVRAVATGLAGFRTTNAAVSELEAMSDGDGASSPPSLIKRAIERFQLLTVGRIARSISKAVVSAGRNPTTLAAAVIKVFVDVAVDEANHRTKLLRADEAEVAKKLIGEAVKRGLPEVIQAAKSILPDGESDKVDWAALDGAEAAW